MTLRKTRCYLALAAGTAVTLVLCALGFLYSETNVDLSYRLYWQGLLLQDLLPCITLGSVALCDSVAINATLFWAGIPVGIVLYSVVAWGLLHLLRLPRPPAGS